MTPFPGQSVGCVDANGGGVGWFLSNDIWHRAGSHAIAAGDVWHCFAYHDSAAGSLLEPGDTTDLDTRWVVEVLSGSGTLALSDYDDAGFSEPTTAGPYGALGTITVDGPGTYTLPTSTFSHDAIRTAGLTGGTLALRLECTAGSVDVQQVKFRAWPAAGVGGGWSDPYTGDVGVTGLTPQTSQAPALGLLSEYPDQASFRADLAAATLDGATGVDSVTVGSGGMFAIYNPPTDTTTVGGGGGPGYLRRDVAGLEYAPPGTFGVDWINPPEEVEGDANDVLFQSTGTDTVAWTQPQATAVIESNVSSETGFLYEGTVTLYGATVAAPHAAGASFLGTIGGATLASVTPASPGPKIYLDVTLPEFPADEYLRFSVDHNGFYADIPEDGGANLTLYYGATTDETTFDRLTYSWTPAPYRYWSPNAVTVAPMRLMQRGDGLGMGSGRVYGVGTRQGGLRVYGPY